MKHWIKILSVFLFFSLIFLPKNTEARSGCCSHHGGVCGCRCCDGSSLSSTCAPYYPSCNTTVKTVVQPTSTPRPTAVPTKKPTSTPTKIPTPTNTPISIITNTPTPEPTKIEEISPTSTPQPQILGETNTVKKPTEPAKTSDVVLGFSILGLIAFGIYKLFVKTKNKIKDYFGKK